MSDNDFSAAVENYKRARKLLDDFLRDIPDEEYRAIVTEARCEELAAGIELQKLRNETVREQAKYLRDVTRQVTELRQQRQSLGAKQ